MRWRRVIEQRLRSLFRRERAESDLHSEIEFHLHALTQENIAAGMTREQARLAAQRALGNAALMEEQCRDQRRTPGQADLVAEKSRDRHCECSGAQHGSS